MRLLALACVLFFLVGPGSDAVKDPRHCFCDTCFGPIDCVRLNKNPRCVSTVPGDCISRQAHDKHLKTHTFVKHHDWINGRLQAPALRNGQVPVQQLLQPIGGPAAAQVPLNPPVLPLRSCLTRSAEEVRLRPTVPVRLVWNTTVEGFALHSLEKALTNVSKATMDEAIAAEAGRYTHASEVLPTNSAQCVDELREVLDPQNMVDVAYRCSDATCGQLRGCKSELEPQKIAGILSCSSCGKMEFEEQEFFTPEYICQRIFDSMDDVAELEYGWNEYHNPARRARGEMNDFMNGTRYRDAVTNGWISHPHDMLFMISCDGFQPFMERVAGTTRPAGGIELVPFHYQILVSPNRRGRAPFCGTFYLQKGRVQSWDDFVSVIKQRLIVAAAHGIEVTYPTRPGGIRRTAVRKFVPFGFLSDSPAVADMSGMLKSSAKRFCRYCEVEGKPLNDWTGFKYPRFPVNPKNAAPFFRPPNGVVATEQAPARTAASHARDLALGQPTATGVARRSPLDGIISFHPIDFWALDTLHLLFHGYVKYFFQQWLDRGFFTIDEMQAAIDRIQVPVGIRRICVVKRWKNWKAEAWYRFVWCFSLHTLQTFLPDEYFSWWVLLVVALTLLYDSPTERDLRAASALIVEHLHQTVEIYDRINAYGYTSHSLLHLPGEVRRWGSAKMLGMWRLEALHRVIKRLIHSPANLPTAIMNRSKLVKLVEHIKLLHPNLLPPPPPLSTRGKLLDEAGSYLEFYSDAAACPALAALNLPGVTTHGLFKQASLIHFNAGHRKVESRLRRGGQGPYESTRVAFRDSTGTLRYGYVEAFYVEDAIVNGVTRHRLYAFVRPFNLAGRFFVWPLLHPHSQPNTELHIPLCDIVYAVTAEVFPSAQALQPVYLVQRVTF